MANRPSVQSPSSDTPASAPPAGLPLFTEPEVRRWPHPVDGVSPPVCLPVPGDQPNSALPYLCRAVSQQNQLLSEIKALLEHLAADPAPESNEK